MAEFVKCNVAEEDKKYYVSQVGSSCYTYNTKKEFRTDELNDNFMISITNNHVDTKYNDIDIDVIMYNYNFLDKWSNLALPKLFFLRILLRSNANISFFVANWQS